MAKQHSLENFHLVFFYFYFITSIAESDVSSGKEERAVWERDYLGTLSQENKRGSQLVCASEIVTINCSWT